MAMPELQRLLMNAQRDPDSMDEIRRLMEQRLAAQRAANYSGMGAAGSYGQMSLEEMIAKASGQETDRSLMGGIGRAMDDKMMDVGGGIDFWDWLKAF